MIKLSGLGYGVMVFEDVGSKLVNSLQKVKQREKAESYSRIYYIVPKALPGLSGYETTVST